MDKTTTTFVTLYQHSSTSHLVAIPAPSWWPFAVGAFLLLCVVAILLILWLVWVGWSVVRKRDARGETSASKGSPLSG